MNAMDETHQVELLHRAWDAMAQGDLAVLEDALAPDARWHGLEDGQLCGNRKAILDVMRRNLPRRLRGEIAETIQDGSRVIVGFRPENPAQVDRPLDDGIGYMVVTIHGGKIIEMRACADRATAVAYSQSHERSARK